MKNVRNYFKRVLAWYIMWSFSCRFFYTCDGCKKLFWKSINLKHCMEWFHVKSKEYRIWGLKKPKSLSCLEVKLLHEVILDLLQPIQAVLDLQVNLRVLKMVPNDSPYPKTWGLKKNQVSSLLRSGVTPWRAPPPPQTFDDDFPHLNDVFVLLHHVFWVRLYLSYPDQKKTGL